MATPSCRKVLYTLQEAIAPSMLLSHIECGRLPPLPYKPWRKDKDVPTPLHVEVCWYILVLTPRLIRQGWEASTLDVGQKHGRSYRLLKCIQYLPAARCGHATLSGVGTPTRGTGQLCPCPHRPARSRGPVGSVLTKHRDIAGLYRG
ncbi:hypothetical protein AAC387_Pa01g0153 [Persea americana]